MYNFCHVSHHIGLVLGPFHFPLHENHIPIVIRQHLLVPAVSDANSTGTKWGSVILSSSLSVFEIKQGASGVRLVIYSKTSLLFFRQFRKNSLAIFLRKLCIFAHITREMRKMNLFYVCKNSFRWKVYSSTVVVNVSAIPYYVNTLIAPCTFQLSADLNFGLKTISLIIPRHERLYFSWKTWTRYLWCITLTTLSGSESCFSILMSVK